jgi:predicted amidophosphoribosyltransferase
MARAGKDVLSSDTLLIPVPAHWTRLVARRYNQAAELARALSSETGCRVCQDGLIRLRRTKVHDGMGVDARFANMDGAIVANPRRKGIFAGAQVCLIDDVMTSGATLAAAASACSASGAEQIFVLVLARVEKSP